MIFFLLFLDIVVDVGCGAPTDSSNKGHENVLHCYVVGIVIVVARVATPRAGIVYERTCGVAQY